jgi:hypothetical protein
MHPRGNIDRYLAEGLPADTERELREHLRSCEECRRLYDEEVRLRRALAGDPKQPTRTEEARLRRLVLDRAGLVIPLSAPTRAPSRALADRIRSNPWRFAVPMGAAALAMLVGLWIIHPWHAEPIPPKPQRDTPAEPVLAARLTQAKEVTIDGAPAKPGATIRSGAEVAVSGAGLAELELLRGGRTRLFPRTRLKLTPRGETIELESGKVWCEVTAGRGRFVVAIERGEARVLGTSFVVEKLSSGDTDVRVLSGTVEVEDSGHAGMVRVQEGQRTRLLSGAPPTQVLRYDPQSDRGDWEQAFRRLGREIERTFRKLGDKLRIP